MLYKAVFLEFKEFVLQFLSILVSFHSVTYPTTQRRSLKQQYFKKTKRLSCVVTKNISFKYNKPLYKVPPSINTELGQDIVAIF